jgi:hypothetical protein
MQCNDPLLRDFPPLNCLLTSPLHHAIPIASILRSTIRPHTPPVVRGAVARASGRNPASPSCLPICHRVSGGDAYSRWKLLSCGAKLRAGNGILAFKVLYTNMTLLFIHLSFCEGFLGPCRGSEVMLNGDPSGYVTSYIAIAVY